MKKLFSLSAIILLMTILISGYGNAERSKIPAKIRIGWQPGITTLFEIAVAQGWFETEFKKDGIKLEYVKFLSGPPLIEAFAGGRLEIGHVGDQPLIQARANNIDLKAIAVQTRGYKTLGLVVPEGSPIKSPRELKGKKIGVMVGSAAHHLLYRYLESNGLAIGDIKLINLNPPDIKTALATKDIDAAVLWEPWISTVEYEKIGRQIADSGGLKLSVGLVIASNEFINNYPDVTKRILKIYVRGAKWIKENPEKAAEVIAKNSGMKQEIIFKAISKYEYDLRLDDEAVKSLADTTEFLRENNLIRRDVNPRDLIDTRFLKELDIQ